MARNGTRTLSRHRTDRVSLTFGVIFLGVAGTWALGQADLAAELAGLLGVSVVQPYLLLAGLLIAAGIIGLVGIRPRRSTSAAHQGDGEPASDPGDNMR